MDGPEPLDLTDATAGRNPLRDLLDEIGLPWRDSRQDLASRHGIGPHPAYPWDVIGFETRRPLAAGLLWPLWANARDDFAPHLPITQFTGAVFVEPDAATNIAVAAEPLAERLGVAQIGQRYNTFRCEWRCGAASITLTAWPTELRTTTLKNTAHERDPRLVTACHVAVATGFRPPLAAHETRWLGSFVPVLPAGHRASTEREIRHSAAPEGLLEFAREPAVPLARLLGRAGRSQDGEALIVCSDQLYVIATEQVLDFRVLRLCPAKGGGGATLEALCATGDPARSTKTLTVAKASGTHDLDEAGPAFAAALGKGCELCTPFPDI